MKKLLLVFLLTLSFAAQAQYQRAVILLYHHIDTTTPAITSISPELFEQQLQLLEDQGFTVWPLPDIVHHMAEAKPLPDKVVALTFDDAYRSVYTMAFPLLKKRQWPFTLFVNTEAVDKHHGLQVSWEQMREMAREGATIANHSVSHAHLAHRLEGETEAAWQQRVSDEITRAEQRIEEETGRSEKLFAYPYGEFDLALKLLVKDMGYTAFGQQSGAWGPKTDRQAIPRFAFAGPYIDIKDFSLKASTLPFPITTAATENNPLSFAKSKPRLRLEFEPGSYQQLACYGSGQGALQLEWLDGNIVSVIPKQEIPVGRSRVNCTMPTGKGRFYWYSHQWIRLDNKEQWILD